MPNSPSSCSVAKIRFLTRKSGWPMCAPSTAPSRPRTIRRKSGTDLTAADLGSPRAERSESR
jgi:hypothetical protein